MPIYHATQVNVDRELTLLQKKFCENYLSNGMLGKKAVIDAGYTCKHPAVRAMELLNNPRCRYYMQSRANKLQKDLELPLDYLMTKLKNVVEEYIPDDKTLFERDKVVVGLSAIKEINQIQGNYAAEKRINISVDGDKHLERIKELTEKAILEHKKEY